MKLIATILTLATLGLIGCAIEPLELRNVELVGGGGSVRYMAPDPGTVYLVNMRKGELVASHRLEAGDVYWTNVDVLRSEGVKVRGRDLRLYFQPDVGNPPVLQTVEVRKR
jgi:hypothetical protein